MLPKMVELSGFPCVGEATAKLLYVLIYFAVVIWLPFIAWTLFCSLPNMHWLLHH